MPRSDVEHVNAADRNQSDSVPVTVKATVGMRRCLSKLVEEGIYGRDVEEVCERLICRALQKLFAYEQ